MSKNQKSLKSYQLFLKIHIILRKVGCFSKKQFGCAHMYHIYLAQKKRAQNNSARVHKNRTADHYFFKILKKKLSLDVACLSINTCRRWCLQYIAAILNIFQPHNGSTGGCMGSVSIDKIHFLQIHHHEILYFSKT